VYPGHFLPGTLAGLQRYSFVPKTKQKKKLKNHKSVLIASAQHPQKGIGII
jgi:hypothetical protein